MKIPLRHTHLQVAPKRRRGCFRRGFAKLSLDFRANEVLALLNCGAYSIAQMFQYNGRQLPAVVLIKENGEVEMIRKRDSYEDLLTNDAW